MATLTKAQQTKARELINLVLEAGKHVSKIGDEDLWMSYDREADVFYVSLGQRQKATDSIMLDDIGVLLRYRGKKLIGITVLDASKR